MSEVDFKKVVLTLPKTLNFPGLKLGRWKVRRKIFQVVGSEDGRYEGRCLESTGGNLKALFHHLGSMFIYWNLQRWFRHFQNGLSFLPAFSDNYR